MRSWLAFFLAAGLCAAQRPPRRLMTPQEFQAISSRAADYRLAYGREAEQFGELRVPSGAGKHPVAILIHGGCWRADFSKLSDLRPIGEALRAKGVATWNLEYRRLGQPGGGWPGTYLDVGSGIDYLRSIAAEKKLDLGQVIVAGHSAGGHLALWAAARSHLAANSELYVADPLRLRGAIDLAGTGDMEAFLPFQNKSCGGRPVVEEMMGGKPGNVPARYHESSALRMLPLGVQQTLVWGKRDKVLPISVGAEYVAAAKRKGEAVNFLVFDDLGHFEIATPMASSWAALEKEMLRMLAADE